MINRIRIVTDERCLYIYSKVQAAKTGIFFLLFFPFALWVFLCYVCLAESTITVEGILFLIILPSLVYVLTLGRYTTWQLWGEERLIISTKAVSYQYSYGIVELNKVTITFKELSVAYEITDTSGEEEEGQLILLDYDEHNMPYELFRSTLPIKRSDMDTIFKALKQLKMKELVTENCFIPFSLN